MPFSQNMQFENTKQNRRYHQIPQLPLFSKSRWGIFWVPFKWRRLKSRKGQWLNFTAMWRYRYLRRTWGSWFLAWDINDKVITGKDYKKTKRDLEHLLLPSQKTTHERSVDWRSLARWFSKKRAHPSLKSQLWKFTQSYERLPCIASSVFFLWLISAPTKNKSAILLLRRIKSNHALRNNPLPAALRVLIWDINFLGEVNISRDHTYM